VSTHYFRKRRPLFAALTLAGALSANAALGQEIERLPQDDYRALLQRLDNQEARIQSLSSQLERQSSMQQAAFENLADEKAKDEKKKDDTGGPKKEEILTKPTVKLGGRASLDHMMIDQSAVNLGTYGDVQNRTRFDTIRLKAEGDVYENVGFKVEFAFGEQSSTTDEPVAKDVYLELREVAPIGFIRVGHYKEPFGLDQLTSALHITFMERNLSDIFAPARNAGFMAYNHVFQDETLSWYSGIFRSEIGDSPVDEQEDFGDWAWTSRVGWNPFYDEPTEGRYLTHVGAAYSYREFGDDTVTFSKDAEMNFVWPAGNPLNVTLVADEVHLAGIELAMVAGPLHAQTEWIHARVNGAGTPGADYNGYYAQAGYFLTGEHKGYKKSTHAFDRTKINEPFFSVYTCDGICRGWGAWEAKARYSYVDLNDGANVGGRLEDFSTGMNWYLNSYCRIMFDYVHTISESQPATALGVAGASGGSANEFGTRFQIDF
jgi:phosphate-selective porin OprO and OprP